MTVCSARRTWWSGDHSWLLQQVHIARWEPAAESVLLVFPAATIQDLLQHNQPTHSKAQLLSMPLPGEGVQGPTVGEEHGLGT